MNASTNKLKFEAAKKYCEENNNSTFKIVTENDICKLSTLEIKKLKESGAIKFIDRYEEKFKKLFGEEV